MGILLFAVGLLWAGIGIANIYSGLSNISASGWSSNFASLNLMINVPIFVIPGLVAVGLGHYLHNKKAPAKIPEKKCPECAELIKKEAKICRFCGFKFKD